MAADSLFEAVIPVSNCFIFNRKFMLYSSFVSMNRQLYHSQGFHIEIQIKNPGVKHLTLSIFLLTTLFHFLGENCFQNNRNINFINPSETILKNKIKGTEQAKSQDRGLNLDHKQERSQDQMRSTFLITSVQGGKILKLGGEIFYSGSKRLLSRSRIYR